jgi:hypothetical protein
MRIAWASKGPPPLMMLSGDNRFIRRRAVRHLISQGHKAGYGITSAASDGEVIDAITMSTTFGLPTLVVVAPGDLSVDTAKALISDKPPKVGILIEVEGPVDEKKMPVTALVHGAYQTTFGLPKKRKDLEILASKFVSHEADSLLGQKGSIEKKVVAAIVRSVGTDFGMLSYEMIKVTALVRSRGGDKITVPDLQQTLRASAASDMQPLRDALARADEVSMAKALSKIRQKSVSDPTMLLLRARGGPADLAYQWLRASLLLEKGMDARGIASDLGIPEWAATRDVIPAAKKWGMQNLSLLVHNLSLTDRGVLSGIPSPWVSCEATLLNACRSVVTR